MDHGDMHGHADARESSVTRESVALHRGRARAGWGGGRV